MKKSVKKFPIRQGPEKLPRIFSTTAIVLWLLIIGSGFIWNRDILCKKKKKKEQVV